MKATHRDLLWWAVTAIALSCMTYPSIVAAQSTSRVIIEAPAELPKQHLRIARGITNAEYRQQLLAASPLGTSYEQVLTFVRSELRFEKQSPGQQATLQDKRGYAPTRLLQEQPPHAKTTYVSATMFAVGYAHAYAYFYKSNFGGPWTVLRTEYLFDEKHRLIDIYCQADGRVIDVL